MQEIQSGDVYSVVKERTIDHSLLSEEQLDYVSYNRTLGFKTEFFDLQADKRILHGFTMPSDNKKRFLGTVFLNANGNRLAQTNVHEILHNATHMEIYKKARTLIESNLHQDVLNHYKGLYHDVSMDIIIEEITVDAIMGTNKMSSYIPYEWCGQIFDTLILEQSERERQNQRKLQKISFKHDADLAKKI